MTYVKLFASILDSTVWDTDPQTKVVWITMLAMADRDGVVEASIPGLAKRAGVDRGACERALALFLAPDPDSRTQEFEGRRIEQIDGGWRLLNYDKYRLRATKEEALSKAAERQRRYRERQRKVTPRNAPSRPVAPSDASNDKAEAQAEAHTEAAESATPSREPGWLALWQEWDALLAGTGGDHRPHEKRLSAALRACQASDPSRPPREVFRDAVRRFSAAERNWKRLGLAVLCSQLAGWLEDKPDGERRVDHAASREDHAREAAEQELPDWMREAVDGQ